MKTVITIDERINGVLVPLREVIYRLPIGQARTVRLRTFRMHYGQPFGLSLLEFEKRTQSDEGLVLDSDSFQRFAATEMQIIDGTIELDIKLQDCFAQLVVECIDASQWELSSESSDVIGMIKSRGSEPA
jgi:hypothetical protein